MKIAIYWLLSFAPSLPLLAIYLAFRSVLDSKKFEMRMLLKRGESLTQYLEAYGSRRKYFSKIPSKTPTNDDLIEKIVDEIFRLHYSDLEYSSALLFDVAVITMLTALTLSHMGLNSGIPENIQSILVGGPYIKNIVAGGAGALIWGLYELTERYRSGDLPPDRLFSLGARIIALSAVGAVIGVIITDRLAWPVAFGIGVLPMTVVKKYISEQVLKKLNMPGPVEITTSPSLTLLQGWNEDVSDRLLRAESLPCRPWPVQIRSKYSYDLILNGE